jgi:serine/threonine protein kinase
MTLLSKGAYGCVYYPKVRCSGKKTNNTKYVSKIQESNFTSKNEIYVSNLIKTQIPRYGNMFSVIVRSCPVEYKEIKDTEIAECPLINNEDDNEIVLMDLEYIKNVDIYKFLEESTDFYFVIRKILHSYKYLLNSIKQLSSRQIVHFDLKPDNILIDTVRSVPIIIDFGLSLDINKVLQAFAGEKTNIALLKNHFFTSYPKYYIWPIEVHYICYLLNVNEKPTEKDIERMCDEYVDGNEILNELYSKSFVNKYRSECFTNLKQYIGEKSTDVIKTIVKDSYSTWDNYSLSVIMMNLLYLLNFNGFGENKLIVDFSQLLLTNIHPNFKKRMLIQDTINRFGEITYRDGIIEDSNFGVLVNNINRHISDFINELRLNTRRIKRLTADFKPSTSS